MAKKLVHYTPRDKAAETLCGAAAGAAVGGYLGGPVGAVVGGLLGAASSG